jgi:hypothetical protein
LNVWSKEAPGGAASESEYSSQMWNNSAPQKSVNAPTRVSLCLPPSRFFFFLTRDFLSPASLSHAEDNDDTPFPTSPTTVAPLCPSRDAMVSPCCRPCLTSARTPWASPHCPPCLTSLTSLLGWQSMPNRPPIRTRGQEGRHRANGSQLALELRRPLPAVSFVSPSLLHVGPPFYGTDVWVHLFYGVKRVLERLCYNCTN